MNRYTKQPPGNIHTTTSLYSNSYSDDVADFRTYAAAYGVTVPDVVADGKIHRFWNEGDKRGSKNGWYLLFACPVAAGAFGSWKTGESYTWCSKSKKHLSHAEREALKRQYHEARLQRSREQQANQQAAKHKAAVILSRAIPANPKHGYLVKKHLPGACGLLDYKGSLLAELRDIDGVLHSLQFIKPDSSKFFLKHGRIKGVFHTFGTLDDSTKALIIGEGISTAATVHHWKQQTTLAAMHAGNLLPVGLAVRQAYPHIKITFAADNDRFNTSGNVGRDKAEEAARICGGSVLLPEFPKGSKGTDWNDLYIEKGGVLE